MILYFVVPWMTVYSLLVIKYFYRVYRTTSKYCRIMARRILNNTRSSMITSHTQYWMFWRSTSDWYSCHRNEIIGPKTSETLRDPIDIFIQARFLSNPIIEIVPWCLTELDLTLPRVKVGGNSVQFHPNTCNRIVDLRLTPKTMRGKENGSSNIGKQEQYITDDHPDSARFYHLVHHLLIPQLSSSAVLHHLHCQHCNSTKTILPRIWHNCCCCFMSAVTPKSGFSRKQIASLAGNS